MTFDNLPPVDDVPNEQSLRNILPLNFLTSANPIRITKLKEERETLTHKLHAINIELATLETLSLLVKTNGS